MGSLKMLHNKKGQVRILEAMLCCFILVIGIIYSIRISTVYSTIDNNNLQTVAENIIGVLQHSDAVSSAVKNQSGWEAELAALMQSLLAPDTYYKLTLRNQVTGEVEGELTNFFQSNSSMTLDSLTVGRTITVSIPQSKVVPMPVDVMLIMDCSGSMADRINNMGETKIVGAKAAAISFLDQLNSSKDSVGLVRFSTTVSTPITGLTTNFLTVENSINNAQPDGWTDIGDSIGSATDELVSSGRPDSFWAIILLTDGKANRPQYPGSQHPSDAQNEAYAGNYALQKANEAGYYQIRTYTIGLGSATSDYNATNLQNIASATPGGQYYPSPTVEDLTQIYSDIVKTFPTLSVSYNVVVMELTLMKPQ
jgi:hypothetical protein